MSTHKRINITIHPIELKKLDKIAKQYNETRSGMITRFIQDYKPNERDMDDLLGLGYYPPPNKKKPK